MLELITGNIREGKTLRATERARELHLQNEYCLENGFIDDSEVVPIYTNFDIKYREAVKIEVDDLLDLEGLKRGLLVIDEAYTWLESRVSSSKLNRYVSVFLFQSGKRGVDVVATAQLGSTIDLRFCELAHFQVLTYKDIGARRFVYKYAMRLRLGVKFFTQVLPFDVAELFWNDYDTSEPVKPLGIEELQVEMAKHNGDKYNRIIDDLVRIFMDERVREWLHWNSERDVFEYQIRDLLMRWCQPVILAPDVYYRVKTLLRSAC